MSKRSQSLGGRGEDAAARHLEAMGYTIRTRNYRKRFGEVDIVAEKDGVWIFVEVKTRSSDRCGTPAEAVDARKQRKICAAALSYISEYGKDGQGARFDVIEVYVGKGGLEIVHIPDAFLYEDPV